MATSVFQFISVQTFITKFIIDLNIFAVWCIRGYISFRLLVSKSRNMPIFNPSSSKLFYFSFDLDVVIILVSLFWVWYIYKRLICSQFICSVILYIFHFLYVHALFVSLARGLLFNDSHYLHLTLKNSILEFSKFLYSMALAKFQAGRNY